MYRIVATLNYCCCVVVVVVVDTRRLDFRGFLESVDSSERFVCVFCNGAVVDLGEFCATFGVAFA